MNWNDNNLVPLQYGLYDKSKYSGEQKNLMKDFCKTHTHLSCAYCGGTYKKVSYCFISGGEIKPCCHLCHVVVEFSPKDDKMIMFCESNKSQLDIIRETINYIINERKFPSILQIDPLAKYANMKFSKFFESNENIKIFFTQELEYTKILSNIVNTMNEFDDFVVEENIEATVEEKIKKERKNIIQRLEEWKKKCHSLQIF